MAIYKICLALRETTERPDDRTELTFNAQTTGELLWYQMLVRLYG